jgi:hypothetical protein
MEGWRAEHVPYRVAGDEADEIEPKIESAVSADDSQDDDKEPIPKPTGVQHQSCGEYELGNDGIYHLRGFPLKRLPFNANVGPSGWWSKDGLLHHNCLNCNRNHPTEWIHCAGRAGSALSATAAAGSVLGGRSDLAFAATTAAAATLRPLPGLLGTAPPGWEGGYLDDGAGSSTLGGGDVGGEATIGPAQLKIPTLLYPSPEDAVVVPPPSAEEQLAQLELMKAKMRAVSKVHLRVSISPSLHRCGSVESVVFAHNSSCVGACLCFCFHL